MDFQVLSHYRGIFILYSYTWDYISFVFFRLLRGTFDGEWRQNIEFKWLPDKAIYIEHSHRHRARFVRLIRAHKKKWIERNVIIVRLWSLLLFVLWSDGNSISHFFVIFFVYFWTIVKLKREKELLLYSCYGIMLTSTKRQTITGFVIWIFLFECDIEFRKWLCGQLSGTFMCNVNDNKFNYKSI